MLSFMLRSISTALGLAALTMTSAADVIQLKDNASISGRILAEKKDQVVVDVGYTVLLVPRDQVDRIVRAEASTSAAPTERGAESGQPDGAAPAGPTPAAPVAPVASPTPVAAVPSGAPEDSILYASAAPAAPERSVRELVGILGESVVQVRTPSGLGSGFFLNAEGYLITNFHVIEGETQISVEVYHQRGGQLERKTYRQVRIVAMNKFEDLALLRIEDPSAPKFVPVSIGRTDALAVGERVFAIGSPLGLERTVTEGIVSTKTRQMQGGLYLQTTAQINPGNSGGPLFNLRGEVVGVTNMKMTFGEGLGFAIPTEQLRYFLDHRDAFAYDNDNPSNAYRYLEPPRRMKQPAEAAEAKAAAPAE